MTRTKKITLELSDATITVTLQSVSPSWYYDMCDRNGITANSSKRRSAKWMDELFRNCVVEPADIRNKGIEYFDEQDDIAGAEELNKEIESFLRQRTRQKRSDAESQSERSVLANGFIK